MNQAARGLGCDIGTEGIRLGTYDSPSSYVRMEIGDDR